MQRDVQLVRGPLVFAVPAWRRDSGRQSVLLRQQVSPALTRGRTGFHPAMLAISMTRHRAADLVRMARWLRDGMVSGSERPDPARLLDIQASLLRQRRLHSAAIANLRRAA